MKNKYYILILLLVFILCGCTVSYDVEIYNDRVYEDFSFYESDSTKWYTSYSSKSENDLEGTEFSEEDSSYKSIIQSELKIKTQAFSGVGDLYYKKSLIDDGKRLGLRYKYDYKLSDYNDALIPKTAFKYFNVLAGNETYVISTSSGVATEYFEDYKYLNTITIHLKTNHKVKENNADRVDGYHYYWDINENNYKDKSVYIELYKDKYIFNYENSITKILIVSITLAILAFIVIIILRKKAKKRNKI